MGSLCAAYHITEANLRLRREFLRLGIEDIDVLKQLAPWARTVAGPIAREFYDFQFEFPGTAEFFGNYATAKGMGLRQMREHLEGAQQRYLNEIFAEAEGGGGFGLAYFERRLKVGMVHNVINMPLKWYVGSYALLVDLLRSALERDFRKKPDTQRAAERALLKVFNLDQQAVSDAFFFDYLRTIGFDLASVPVTRSDFDLSEYRSELKASILAALREAVNVGTALGDSSRDLRAAAEDLARSATMQASALQEMSTTVKNLTGTIAATFERVQESNRLAVGDGRSDETTVVRVVGDLRDSAAKVADLISVVDKIAAQTNLLSLNATIEAARAGQHGRGFAVVASEVRELSQGTARSARDITGLVHAMARQAQDATVFVRKVADLITGISGTAAEQTSAMSEISAAMTELDQSTHMNAGRTEQLAATSRTLDEQAERLRTALARFDAGMLSAEQSSVYHADAGGHHGGSGGPAGTAGGHGGGAMSRIRLDQHAYAGHP